ncbi:MAG: addiction module protein [Marmoricola sp.]
MTLSASEFYEAGLNLPPSVRKDVALRLLQSIPVSDETADEDWIQEIDSRVNDLLSGKVGAIRGDQVFAEISARRASAAG